MTLTSVKFAIFVLLTLICYYSCPKKFRWTVLLVASYGFYAIVCLKYMPFILLTTLTTYLGGLWLGSIAQKATAALKENREVWSAEERKRYKAVTLRQKRGILTGVLLLNFGILVTLKYYNFFADSISSLLGALHLEVTVPTMSLFLPLGISFYTFQAMGYLIDVYRAKVEPEKNIAKFALFVSFFPQIIQGPIGLYSDLARQLYEPHSLQYENIKYGFQLILWGMFKKMVIADRAVGLISTVCEHYTDYSGGFLLLAALFYALQLYADFSGGIDISRGVAQMLGIRLAENFKRPYFSKSISEYWRRWHITLGVWIKEYLFYPIGMSNAFLKLGKITRKKWSKHVGKVLPASIATFITFLVIGIWHGANWKYVAFGLWNGLVIFISNLLEPFFAKCLTKLKIRTECFSYRLFQMVRTFIIVLIGYYFDIANNFGAAMNMMKRSLLQIRFSDFTNLKIWESFGLERSDYVILAIGVLVLFVVSYLQETRQESLREALNRQNIWFQWGIMLAAICSILLFGVYGPGTSAGEFVYMQF